VTEADGSPRRPPGSTGRPSASGLAAVHALAWLTAGNGVGVLLALLLLVPRLGDALAPLGYGRWMPVHWNSLLYGWLALPLVAALLRLYGAPSRIDRAGRWAVAAWSATLAVGCLSWLAGDTTAKPFLEWAGPVRWLLAGTLLFLAAVLAAGHLRHRAGWSRAGRAGRGALRAALLPVPVVLFHAASPRVYPPVNPASGGPTGASLLGSSLAIVALFVLAPRLLGLASPDGEEGRSRAGTRLLAPLVLHFALFLLLVALQPGDHSHHDPLQVAAVASIALWPPVLVHHLRRVRWPPSAGRWLAALGAWGAALVASSIPSALPGVLERWKFTHALVAHAHLAMAGLCSAFAVLVLLAVAPSLAPALAGRTAFTLWNGGTLAHAAAMLWLGTLEGGDPGLVIRGGPAVTALFAVRLLAGVAMLAASVAWLRGGLLAEREASIARDRGAGDPAALDRLDGRAA
jgi:cytochrome c oxidase cbb3-type subunit 1